MAVVRKKNTTVSGIVKRTSKLRLLPSSHKPARVNEAERSRTKKALKTGSVVLEINGKFLRISLSQKVRIKSLSLASQIREGSHLERYEQYMGARTVGEVFKLGGVTGDVSYNCVVGTLKFEPSLKGKEVDEPLPKSEWPQGIRQVVGHAPWWLPTNWAYGAKTTCKCFLPVYIAPNGQTCYHQEVVEAIVGEPLDRGVDRIVAWARKCILEKTDWYGQVIETAADAELFTSLSEQERSNIPPANGFHFSVISARRASELSGIRGIVNVQSRLLAAGVQPRWYVDETSLKEYQRLGLDAVIGGKLCPARNKALRDAARLKKVCVQVSDDITGWEFYISNLDSVSLRAKGAITMLRAANRAKKSSKIDISPLAAARFLLAKMRSAEPRAYLGGVLPTRNGALALMAKMTTPDGFILGDFFVHDGSPCRFDENLSLKEDYDFTCSHLKQHACTMRCNRMVLKVTHEKNLGGAVAYRSCDKERKNIKKLMSKWPGVFKLHSTRGDTQVKMKWTHRKNK